MCVLRRHCLRGGNVWAALLSCLGYLGKYVFGECNSQNFLFDISGSFGLRLRLRLSYDATGSLALTINLMNSWSYIHPDSTCARSDMLSVDHPFLLDRVRYLAHRRTARPFTER